jgi:hypothetical protein
MIALGGTASAEAETGTRSMVIFRHNAITTSFVLPLAIESFQLHASFPSQAFTIWDAQSQ